MWIVAPIACAACLALVFLLPGETELPATDGSVSSAWWIVPTSVLAALLLAYVLHQLGGAGQMQTGSC